MPPRELTVTELIDAAGTDLGASGWLPITQDRIDLFADATDDHQWIHVDPARAANGPFGTTIAHGYLTLSLIPRLLEELVVVTDQARGTNYGLERARFTSPVPVSSDIRLEATIAEVTVRPDGGVQYQVDCTLQVRDQQRPALVASVIYLAYAT